MWWPAREQDKRREGQRAMRPRNGYIFAPRTQRGMPHLLLAQAGTGIGKTLGYLAPASLWSERSQGTVWVSTYTKNLQRQLRRESPRAWPEARPTAADRWWCARARELPVPAQPRGCAAGRVRRARGGAGAPGRALGGPFSQDGDMIGGDLPGWLGTLFRNRAIRSLTDQRGECVYAGCPHYRKCFIERAARASAQADLVIANHALVMVNAARGRDVAQRPTRIVFDEGHHVFEAADSTFSAALTGQEAIELKRWIMGPERGSNADGAAAWLRGSPMSPATTRKAARRSPWPSRRPRRCPATAGCSGSPTAILRARSKRCWRRCGRPTYARDESGGQEAGYGIETEAAQLEGNFVELAQQAAARARRDPPAADPARPRLEALIEDAPDWLDGQGRARIEGARHSLAWRVDTLAAWEALLGRLGGPADPEFVDWLAVERSDAREFDVGLHRHFLDPMKPFAKIVLEPAHGVMLTSATLRDGEGLGCRPRPLGRAAPRRRAAPDPAPRARSTTRRAPKC